LVHPEDREVWLAVEFAPDQQISIGCSREDREAAEQIAVLILQHPSIIVTPPIKKQGRNAKQEQA
jgi:hypothetical protein